MATLKYKILRRNNAIFNHLPVDLLHAEFCYEHNLARRRLTKFIASNEDKMYIEARLTEDPNSRVFRIPLADVERVNKHWVESPVKKREGVFDLPAPLYEQWLRGVLKLPNPTRAEGEESPRFHFQKHTSSIRIMPQNYLVCERANEGAHWSMNPDLSCPLDLVLFATIELMRHENKYGTGDNLLQALKKWEDE